MVFFLSYLIKKIIRLFLTSVKKNTLSPIFTLLYSLSPRFLWSDPAITGLCSSDAATFVEDIKGQKNKEDEFFYIPCACLLL